MFFCRSRISLFNKCFVTAICAGDDKYYKICACDDTHYNGGMGDCSVMGGLCNDVKVYWSPYACSSSPTNAVQHHWIFILPKHGKFSANISAHVSPAKILGTRKLHHVVELLYKYCTMVWSLFINTAPCSGALL